MDGYIQVSLKSYLKAMGEGETKRLLSSFSCPSNADVEYFLHHKAVEFTAHGITQTHLVFCSYKGEHVLVGYYALALKSIALRSATLSKTWCRRIAKFALFDKESRCYILPCPLIGQLSKNFSNGYDKLISGDELLSLACNKVANTQMDIGGKTVYLECEDKPALKNFYRRNGFWEFGKRRLDRDETSLISGEYLIQMLKYLK